VLQRRQSRPAIVSGVLKPVKKPGSEGSVRVSDDVCRGSQRSRLGDCFGFAPQAALCSTGEDDGEAKAQSGRAGGGRSRR